MSALAPTLQAFFTDRLIRQRQASGHTIAAYRDTLRLLLAYATERTGIAPSSLDLADLDAALITGFLGHLERDRGNRVRTRNARLAAIHSLFRFAALAHPEHAESISRVLAIHPNASTGRWSPTSPRPRSMRCSPAATRAPGPGGVTTLCCCSPCRPGCGSPS